MEAFIAQIAWTPVLVSTVSAYLLGWAWYSPVMFYKKWMEGKGGNVVSHPMWMPMSAQLGATFLLAIIVNIFMTYDNVIMSVLVGLTIAGFIKANGLYSGKSKWAISVETLYVLAMVVLMLVVNSVM
jgi:hypothetical protein